MLIVALPWVFWSGMPLWLLNHYVGFLGTSVSPALLFPFGIGMGAAFAFTSLLRMRAWSAVVSADFNVCPCCEYPLQGLAPSGRCPECGDSYETSKVTAHWRKAIDHAAQSEACLRLSEESMNQTRRVIVFCLVAALIGTGVGSLLMFGPFPKWATIAGVAVFIMAILTPMVGNSVIPCVIKWLYPSANRDLGDEEPQ